MYWLCVHVYFVGGEIHPVTSLSHCCFFVVFIIIPYHSLCVVSILVILYAFTIKNRGRV
jgi:hypothetical protein